MQSTGAGEVLIGIDLLLVLSLTLMMVLYLLAERPENSIKLPILLELEIVDST